jgi:hypothetical protein
MPDNKNFTKPSLISYEEYLGYTEQCDVILPQLVDPAFRDDDKINAIDELLKQNSRFVTAINTNSLIIPKNLLPEQISNTLKNYAASLSNIRESISLSYEEYLNYATKFETMLTDLVPDPSDPASHDDSAYLKDAKIDAIDELLKQNSKFLAAINNRSLNIPKDQSPEQINNILESYETLLNDIRESISPRPRLQNR